MSQSEATLVKEHVLARLSREVDRQLLDAIKGLGKFLTAGEISTVVDPLIRAIVYEKHEAIKSAARKYLEEDLYSTIPVELVDVFHRRLDDWIAHFQKQNQEERAHFVRDIRAACDIPF